MSYRIIIVLLLVLFLDGCQQVQVQQPPPPCQVAPNSVACQLDVQRQANEMALEQRGFAMREQNAQFWRSLVWAIFYAAVILLSMWRLQYYVRLMYKPQVVLERARIKSNEAIEVARARASRLPENMAFQNVATLTHNPNHSTTTRTDHRHTAPKAVHGQAGSSNVDVSLEQAALPVSIPTLQDMFKRPERIIGYTEVGEPIVEAEHTLHKTVLGGSQRGKSTWTLIHILQNNYNNPKRLAIVIDPHLHNPKSLGARVKPFYRALLSSPFGPRDIAEGLDLVWAIYQDRLTREGEKFSIIDVVIDEALGIARGEHAAKLEQVVSTIVNEGAKFGFRLIMLFQDSKVSQIGDVARGFDAHISFGCTRKMVASQTRLRERDLPDDIVTLARGRFYYFDGVNEIERLTLPEITEHALQFLMPKPLEMLEQPDAPESEKAPQKSAK